MNRIIIPGSETLKYWNWKTNKTESFPSEIKIPCPFDVAFINPDLLLTPVSVCPNPRIPSMTHMEVIDLVGYKSEGVYRYQRPNHINFGTCHMIIFTVEVIRGVDKTLLVGGGEDQLLVWNLGETKKMGKELRNPTTNSPCNWVHGLKWCEEKSFLALGFMNRLEFWNMEKSSTISSNAGMPLIFEIQYHKEKNLVAVAGGYSRSRSELRFLDSRSRKPVSSINYNEADWFNSCGFLQNECIGAGTSNGKVVLFDLRKLKKSSPMKTIDTGGGRIWCVRSTKDDNYFVAGGENLGYHVYGFDGFKLINTQSSVGRGKCVGINYEDRNNYNLNEPLFNGTVPDINEHNNPDILDFQTFNNDEVKDNNIVIANQPISPPGIRPQLPPDLPQVVEGLSLPGFDSPRIYHQNYSCGDVVTSSGIVSVKVIKCLNVKAADIGGTSDVFCVVSIGEIGRKKMKNSKGKIHKTNIVKKTLNPVFEENEFKLNVTSSMGEWVYVDVFDWDRITKNDHLGFAKFPLSSLTKNHPFQLSADIADGDGTCFVQLTTSFGYPNPTNDEAITQFCYQETRKRMKTPKGGLLSVKLFSCSGLEIADPMAQSSDPYVKLFLKKKGEKSRESKKGIKKLLHKEKKPFLKSPTIKNNLNPVWNNLSTNVFVENMKKEYLDIQVFDWDRLSKDDLIGFAKIDLEDLVIGVEIPLNVRLHKKGVCSISLVAVDFGNALSSDWVHHVTKMKRCESGVMLEL